MSDFSQTDFSYLMILLAGLLPYLFTLLAKIGSGRMYNNHDPREFLAQLEGKHKRANNAQLNSFEAFPLFAVGVLVAHQKLGTSPDYFMLNLLSMCFVLARITYGWAYISDYASFRSLIWFVGFAIACSLYF